MPIAHQKDLRKGRFSQTGQIYHITTTTLAREPIFNDFFAARTLINILRQAETRQQAQTLAFVIMPDHLHWLLQLGTTQNLSAVVQNIKAASTRANKR